jgi:hypothetical protein
MLNSYLVRMGSATQDTMKFKSGVELFLETRVNFEEKVSLFGEVVRDAPRGHEEVKKGDRIYFRYDVVSDGDFDDNGIRRYKNRYDMNGEDLWSVPVDRVIAVVKGGEVKPLGRYVIGMPVKRPKWESKILVMSDLSEEEVPDLMDVKYDAGEFKAGERLLVGKDHVSRYNFESKEGEEVLVVMDEYIFARVVESEQEFQDKYQLT